MTAPAPADFRRTERPDGSTHYRLPDEATILWPLLLFAAFGAGGLVFQATAPEAGVRVPPFASARAFVCCAAGASLLLSGGLLMLAILAGDYFLTARGELLVTADALAVTRKVGPFWWRRVTPLADVRRVVLTATADGAVARLKAETAGGRVRLSWGEPAGLLRRLHEDLVCCCTGRRRAAGLGPVAALAVEVVAFPAADPTHEAGVVDGRLVVRRAGPFGGEGSCPLAAVRRVVLVDPGQPAVRLSPSSRPLWQLVAVGAGGELLVVVNRDGRDALRSFGPQVADLCRRAGATAVVFDEESDEPRDDRPFRPVYSQVRVEEEDGRVVFTAADGKVRYAVAGGLLTVEWPGWFSPNRHSWFAEEIRRIEVVTVGIPAGEDCSDQRQVVIRPVQGPAVTVPYVSGGRAGAGALADKDNEWLATTLRRRLLGPADDRAEVRPAADGPAHAIQLDRTTIRR